MDYSSRLSTYFMECFNILKINLTNNLKTNDLGNVLEDNFFEKTNFSKRVLLLRSLILS